MDERSLLYDQVTESLRKGAFEISERCVLRPSCFDIIARKHVLILLIKILANIDSMSEVYARQMMNIARMLSASPLLIGDRTRTSEMKEGMVYERFGVPAVNPRTLEDIAVRGILPMLFSSRGGYYVQIDGPLLKKTRLERSMSKGEVADNIGVSRRTIYNYEEENACATFETALRLEEFMGEPIVKPLHILNIPGEISDDKPCFASELEREILGRLSVIGFQVYPVKKAPFNALTVEEEKVMLANIPREKLRVLLKRARILKSISDTTKTSAFFVFDSARGKESLEGVPIVHKVELNEMEESEELVEMLEERAGGKPKFRVI